MPETSARLAAALAAIPGCPPEMPACARYGYYDEWRSPLAAPLVQLVTDLRVQCRAPGVPERSRPMYEALARRVAAGEFDATKAEAEAWAASGEGRETMRLLGIPAQRTPAGLDRPALVHLGGPVVPVAEHVGVLLGGRAGGTVARPVVAVGCGVALPLPLASQVSVAVGQVRLPGQDALPAVRCRLPVAASGAAGYARLSDPEPGLHDVLALRSWYHSPFRILRIRLRQLAQISIPLMYPRLTSGVKGCVQLGALPSRHKRPPDVNGAVLRDRRAAGGARHPRAAFAGARPGTQPGPRPVRVVLADGAGVPASPASRFLFRRHSRPFTVVCGR